MIERGEPPHQSVHLSPEEEDLEIEEVEEPVAPCWGFCINNWRSYLSRNTVVSVLTLNGVFCLLTLNGIFSCFSVNAAFSIFSVNSFFSIASVNSMLSIGCVGGWLEICGKFSADQND